MYRLMVKNDRGEIFDITQSNDEFSIASIDGLSPQPDNMNLSTAGQEDGALYNSSHIGPRNIVLTVVLRGDIERSRQKLYRIFPQKVPITLYFSDTYRNLKIVGYVELPACEPFQKLETAQISIICPDPYWKDVRSTETETALVSGKPTCSLANVGEKDVGFTGIISVHTDETPTLTRSETESDSPTDLRKYHAFLKDSDFNSLDLSTQTLNIFLDGVLQTPGTDYNPELLTIAYTDLWLDFPNGTLGPRKVITAETIRVNGQNVTDMRYYVSGKYTRYLSLSISGIPSWFDLDKDCIVWAIIEGGTGRIIPSSMSATQQADGTWTLQTTFPSADTNQQIECRIFGSVSKMDVHDAVITRHSTDFTLPTYCSEIMSPVLPTYDDSKDILRVYRGDELLSAEDYDFVTAAKSDSSTVQLFMLADGMTVNKAITFEVIHSISGADIREYTDAQIDKGFCLVSGLQLVNTLTNEKMIFSDVKFKSGDVIEISTVQGDLRAVVIESEWMPEGTNLLYSVYRSSTFFKLKKGMNTLEFLADSNAAYVSASFSVLPLYGGV